ncbi:polyisoprenoid-binding protein YceI [Bacillus mesophilus]|uniref:YceI family protein n=1 Tax=Bacillus mesophilus TaxID=1808955 RepID=A0A6M0Q8V3_9BACI|nr:YceI family protein [Bacillus mesophilus]MBM7661498.1 polyisoprenoid-binding protein YceI [Bacillus mesophilus]NEY72169.1 YceI family protein [Bacillus mesophilus]
MTKTKWAVDTAHSGIDFSVRHMVISSVKGSFNSYSASIEADPKDLTTASIDFSVDLASVDTRNEDRDNHLRSADFFDVEQFPTMTFKSTSVEKTDEDEYNVTGDLTLHGVTRQETFKVVYEGSGLDPWGNEKVGFSATGKLNRGDYGLVYNAALETGGVLIGDQIKVSLEIQASKEA